MSRIYIAAYSFLTRRCILLNNLEHNEGTPSSKDNDVHEGWTDSRKYLALVILVLFSIAFSCFIASLPPIRL